jgi:hypothetical protein
MDDLLNVRHFPRSMLFGDRSRQWFLVFLLDIGSRWNGLGVDVHSRQRNHWNRGSMAW